MASNSPAPEGIDIQEQPTAGAWGEWNPTEDSARPPRGKHRVLKQRGGLARSSTVLGVGVIAAVGAGGIATAQDRPQVAISLPALPDLPEALGGADRSPGDSATTAAEPARSGIIPQQADRRSDAGELLRSRILQQAESQHEAAAAQEREEAERVAQEAAAQQARDAQAAKEAAEKAAKEAAEKAAAEEARQAKAAKEAAEAKAKAESAARSAGSFFLPTSAYTLTSHYGDSGSMWSSGHHTGLDFAAPTGTPVKAVGSGKITSAGWSGAYGYRIVLELPDGTEIWYCHLSSMSVTGGSVAGGDTIGRVGATGNVTGPHLHLEVRQGGVTVDPLSWLRARGLNV
ncbi:M23 family metallopeptidase [Streptomyces sp. NBC_01264]|uniref:M23 family metallopeptidase n=1 Tax=Streptomyces sp. NBC_01264 TaxID=2903804 RepID=UPI002257520B|nr:M23 family metallopeptidase [Streptomyces sp. NBC_01264]MCX4779422.1 M23 family metallopeptidase [Streptomyces sp. NBC_01264]